MFWTIEARVVKLSLALAAGGTEDDTGVSRIAGKFGGGMSIGTRVGVWLGTGVGLGLGGMVAVSVGCGVGKSRVAIEATGGIGV